MALFGWSAVAAMCLATPYAPAQVRLDARTLAEKSVGRNVRLATDGSAIELERGELFEDDGPAAGYSYKPNEERLSSQVWVKKELLIPDARADRATLLVAPGGDLRAIVNGTAVDLKPGTKAGNYWQTYSLPIETLKAEKNEIVLHGTGKVWIARAEDFAAGSRTRTKHPNRSARSTDGGKTWDYDRLGSAGDVDGEYYVRLLLDRYRARGVLTLPVMDIGNLAGRPISPALETVGPLRIGFQAEAGTGRLSMRARSGPSLLPDDKNWSAWRELGEGGVLREPAGRFVQVEVELTTPDPRKTPKLKHVVFEAPQPPLAGWARGLRVVERQNEEIVRTAVPFVYEPWDNPTLAKFRKQYRLDEVTKEAKDEFDLITRLAAWSAKQWTKGHLEEGYAPWNAMEILKLHRDRTPVGGFCQQYNVVFLQACESFAIPGRAVSLGPGDHGARIRGGHEVVEVWSNQHKKWIYVDGQAAWYIADEATRVPLSLLELRERQLQKLGGKPARPARMVSLAESRFRWTGLADWPPFVELRLIPRSNFLAEAAPLPLNQGMRGWFWTGHHVWTDDEALASLLYGHRVRRKGDWEWTLNQTRFELEATSTAGELRVHLETETPGFDTFLADIDGGGWQPVKSGFVWKLRAGKNRLEVRTRNSAGREGIISRVVLDLP